MSKRMLIDASHPEETRVVVLDGQKVEEFDFEAATKRPLKGNIYLAKITRVEPSLQAAFVEYGGNRQGFLAFSEIHPDYYQIPVADRLALLAEQEAEARRQAEREDAEDEAASNAVGATGTAAPFTEDGAEGVSPVDELAASADETETAQIIQAGASGGESDEPAGAESESSGDEDDDYFPPPDRHDEPDEEIRPFLAGADEHEHREEVLIPVSPEVEIAEGIADEQAAAGAPFIADIESDEADNESDGVHEGLGEDIEGEAAGPVDPAEEISEGIVDEQAAANAPMDAAQQPSQPLQQRRPSQRWTRRRHYKIQEVIKRRQIILVQVVKEERGNKGAALTTYLSLAGRYCVLMPNTPRGGGISRKITSAADRKRLKGAVQGLELPEGMGLIIRTAGENRTKVEIKRDYEYLLRMWDTVRELTLKSNAPACVYEEGDLIKRAIRDLYNKDVSEVVVEGDEGYRNAKDFMRMLMPSHSKNVKLYKESIPLFQRHTIEAQLDAMFSQTVHLKSGGYVVINQTEALVAIDVNSGRATREHSIEETAHKTNLEAADEIARQLRLRDLAGLIVIDFIDMEDHRNDRNVEKRLYNALKNDRARIQIGKISQFGLLEMSRQRLRAGVIAGSTVPCPHCGGQGIVRSVESTALRVLRAIEDEAQKLKASAVTVKVPANVAIYMLNQKRRELARIENDYGMTVSFEPDNTIIAGDFEIQRTAQRSPDDKPRIAAQMEAGPQLLEAVEEEDEKEEPESEIAEEEVDNEVEGAADVNAEAAREQARQEHRPSEDGGRRRRRRRGGRNRNHGERGDGNPEPRAELRNGQPPPAPHAEEPSENVARSPLAGLEGAPDQMEGGDEAIVSTHTNGAGTRPEGELGEGGRRRRRRRRGRRGRGGQDDGPRHVAGNDAGGVEAGASDGEDRIAPNTASSPLWSLTPDPAISEPVIKRVPEAGSAPKQEPREEAEPTASPAADATGEPPRKGWWQRTFNRAG